MDDDDDDQGLVGRKLKFGLAALLSTCLGASSASSGVEDEGRSTETGVSPPTTKDTNGLRSNENKNTSSTNPSGWNITQWDDVSEIMSNVTLISDVVEPEAVMNIAVFTGFLGTKPTGESLQRLVAGIHGYYAKKGFLFCQVSSRSIIQNGSVTFKATEPRTNDPEVVIKFLNHKSWDTIRRENEEKKQRVNKQKEKEGKEGGDNIAASAASMKNDDKGASSSSLDEKGVKEKKEEEEDGGVIEKPSDLFEVTEGRTKPRVVRDALGLKKGTVTKWDPEKWADLINSGLFEEAVPQITCSSEGKIMVMLLVREPERNGSRKIMGDIKFKDQNFLGLNQHLKARISRRGNFSFEADWENPMLGSSYSYAVGARIQNWRALGALMKGDLFSSSFSPRKKTKENVGDSEEGGAKSSLQGARSSGEGGGTIFENIKSESSSSTAASSSSSKTLPEGRNNLALDQNGNLLMSLGQEDEKNPAHYDQLQLRLQVSAAAATLIALTLIIVIIVVSSSFSSLIVQDYTPPHRLTRSLFGTDSYGFVTSLPLSNSPQYWKAYADFVSSATINSEVAAMMNLHCHVAPLVPIDSQVQWLGGRQSVRGYKDGEIGPASCWVKGTGQVFYPASGQVKGFFFVDSVLGKKIPGRDSSQQQQYYPYQQHLSYPSGSSSTGGSFGPLFNDSLKGASVGLGVQAGPLCAEFGVTNKLTTNLHFTIGGVPVDLKVDKLLSRFSRNTGGSSGPGNRGASSSSSTTEMKPSAAVSEELSVTFEGKKTQGSTAYK
eukprot:jgi/Bigna1/79166/fgenesh1_pg.60_\